MVDVGGLPTVMYPVVASTGIRGPQISFLRLSRTVFAHAIAVFGGSVFIFLFFVAIQGVLINLLRPRAFRIVSRCFQLQAIVALLLFLFLLPIISAGVPAWEPAHDPGFYWVPPLWFVGVYQTLLGSGDAAFHSLATIAVAALGLGTLACAAAYAISYKRQAQRALEAAEARTDKPLWPARATRWVLNQLLLRKPHERATYFFVVNTLMRSTKHRLYAAAYVGVGCALAAFGILEVSAHTVGRDFHAIIREPNQALLSIPLILSFFLLSGMRFVFTIPAELHANWVFRLAEDESWLDCCSGTRKAMVLRAVLLLLLLLPFYAVLWGWLVAFQHFIFGLILSLILVELLLINFRKVPFTCSYQPGKAYITVLGVFYWLAFTTYAYTMATLERYLLLEDPIGWIVFMIFTLLVLGGLILRRKKRLAHGLGLIYEDEPNPDVQTLGLSS
jgi:Ca2+/Na+ antiporter